MNKKLKIFVYGSLREGFFNYDLYLKGKIKSIRPAIIEGYDLYHMPYKGYPAIFSGKQTIIGEVVELIDYKLTLKQWIRWKVSLNLVTLIMNTQEK